MNRTTTATLLIAGVLLLTGCSGDSPYRAGWDHGQAHRNDAEFTRGTNPADPTDRIIVGGRHSTHCSTWASAQNPASEQDRDEYHKGCMDGLDNQPAAKN